MDPLEEDDSTVVEARRDERCRLALFTRREGRSVLARADRRQGGRTGLQATAVMCCAGLPMLCTARRTPLTEKVREVEPEQVAKSPVVSLCVVGDEE